MVKQYYCKFCCERLPCDNIQYGDCLFCDDLCVQEYKYRLPESSSSDDEDDEQQRTDIGCLNRIIPWLFRQKKYK